MDRIHVINYMDNNMYIRRTEISFMFHKIMRKFFSAGWVPKDHASQGLCSKELMYSLTSTYRYLAYKSQYFNLLIT